MTQASWAAQAGQQKKAGAKQNTIQLCSYLRSDKQQGTPTMLEAFWPHSNKQKTQTQRTNNPFGTHYDKEVYDI